MISVKPTSYISLETNLFGQFSDEVSDRAVWVIVCGYRTHRDVEVIHFKSDV
jgi:hypothetical protein